MKLIDFLVSSGRGGWKWPNGIGNASCNAGSRDVIFHFDYCPPALSETLISPCNFDAFDIVTREQYEAALAASKTEWDGEGLPPVGCDCEFKSASGEWVGVEITAIARNGLCFVEPGKTGENYVSFSREFRPIRSEAEKKRDEAETALRTCLAGTGAGITPLAAHCIYDAIAAGNIPHIHID